MEIGKFITAQKDKAVLVSFPVAVINYVDKNDSQEKGFVRPAAPGHGPSKEEAAVGGTQEGRVGHVTHSQAQRAMPAGATPCSVSPFYLVQDMAHEIPCPR